MTSYYKLVSFKIHLYLVNDPVSKGKVNSDQEKHLVQTSNVDTYSGKYTCIPESKCTHINKYRTHTHMTLINVITIIAFLPGWKDSSIHKREHFPVLVEDQSTIPSTHVALVITPACHSSFRLNHRLIH